MIARDRQCWGFNAADLVEMALDSMIPGCNKCKSAPDVWSAVICHHDFPVLSVIRYLDEECFAEIIICGPHSFADIICGPAVSTSHCICSLTASATLVQSFFYAWLISLFYLFC